MCISINIHRLLIIICNEINCTKQTEASSLLYHNASCYASTMNDCCSESALHVDSTVLINIAVAQILRFNLITE